MFADTGFDENPAVSKPAYAKSQGLVFEPVHPGHDETLFRLQA